MTELKGAMVEVWVCPDGHPFMRKEEGRCRHYDTVGVRQWPYEGQTRVGQACDKRLVRATLTFHD